MNTTNNEALDEATKKMIRGWLAMHHGDVEGLARWMRDSLRVGGIKLCRAWITEAAAEVSK